MRLQMKRLLVLASVFSSAFLVACGGGGGAGDGGSGAPHSPSRANSAEFASAAVFVPWGQAEKSISIPNCSDNSNPSNPMLTSATLTVTEAGDMTLRGSYNSVGSVTTLMSITQAQAIERTIQAFLNQSNSNDELVAAQYILSTTPSTKKLFFQVNPITGAAVFQVLGLNYPNNARQFLFYTCNFTASTSTLALESVSLNQRVATKFFSGATSVVNQASLSTSLGTATSGAITWDNLANSTASQKFVNLDLSTYAITASPSLPAGSAGINIQVLVPAGTQETFYEEQFTSATSTRALYYLMPNFVISFKRVANQLRWVED